MIWNIISWIIFGALAGWLASIIMRTDEEQGAMGNIVVGILGAIIGGGIARALIGTSVTGFNLPSLIIAILGAMLLIFLLQLFTGRRSALHH